MLKEKNGFKFKKEEAALHMHEIFAAAVFPLLSNIEQQGHPTSQINPKL